MRTWIAALVLVAFAGGSALAGQGEGQAEDPIAKLKKILKQMEIVEVLLGKARLDEAGEAQKKIIEDLKQKVKEGKLKEDEVIEEIDKQLKVVVKKMKDIDDDIEKLIQSVKMSQCSGGGGMDLDNPKGGKGKKKGEKDKQKAEREKELKRLREEKAKREGAKKEDGKKPGDDPAKRAYEAKGEGPRGKAPRAEGTGRWGNLDPKEFREALASGKIKVPEKYKAMIEKYLEMLTKKATEDK